MIGSAAGAGAGATLAVRGRPAAGAEPTIGDGGAPSRCGLAASGTAGFWDLPIGEPSQAGSHQDMPSAEDELAGGRAALETGDTHEAAVRLALVLRLTPPWPPRSSISSPAVASASSRWSAATPTGSSAGSWMLDTPTPTRLIPARHRSSATSILARRPTRSRPARCRRTPCRPTRPPNHPPAKETLHDRTHPRPHQARWGAAPAHRANPRSYEERGLKIVGLKLVHVERALAERHYDAHREKPFFTGLVDFITSGPLVALALEGPNAIAVVRAINGATRPHEAAPGTIRGDYALETAQNIVHASDGPEAATAELALWFDAGELFDYERDVDRWVLAPAD